MANWRSETKIQRDSPTRMRQFLFINPWNEEPDVQRVAGWLLTTLGEEPMGDEALRRWFLTHDDLISLLPEEQRHRFAFRLERRKREGPFTPESMALDMEMDTLRYTFDWKDLSVAIRKAVDARVERVLDYTMECGWVTVDPVASRWALTDAGRLAMPKKAMDRARIW